MSVTTQPEVVVTKGGEGRTVRFYADVIEIKAQGGDVDVFETTAHAGCEPPMHVHEREDESFYVVDGAVTFFAGDSVVHAGPGTYVFAPRGIPHTYAVDSETARMVVTASPSGFLQMFDAVQDAFGGTMPATPSPDDGPRLGGTLAGFGISIVGPNPSAA